MLRDNEIDSKCVVENISTRRPPFFCTQLAGATFALCPLHRRIQHRLRLPSRVRADLVFYLPPHRIYSQPVLTQRTWQKHAPPTTYSIK